VLRHYVSSGMKEHSQDKLTTLLRIRYGNSNADNMADLALLEKIGLAYAAFQQFLCQPLRG
jgi:type I restriction enzyme R subunit